MENAATAEAGESWVHRLYGKILKSCGHPSAPWLLGVLSFTESCCFIIPPEFLMMPMCYANRKKAWIYGLITTLTSVLGAIAGYYIGSFLWVEVQPYFFKFIPGFAKNFEYVGDLYQDNAVGALLLAAFTPIPYKVFTVVSGIYSAKVTLMTLVGTAIVGRGARYFIMCGLVYFFGEKAQELIENHFKKATIVLAILGVLVITAVVAKKMMA